MTFVYSATQWLIYILHIVDSRPHFYYVHKITAYAGHLIVITYQFNYMKNTMNMDPTKYITVFTLVIIVISIMIENSNANGKYD